MKVSVVCFGALREYLPADAEGNRADLEVAEGATVGDVIDALGAPRRLTFAVLVDGEQAALEARADEGSTVTLMPPFAGGSEAGAARGGEPRDRHLGRGDGGRLQGRKGQVGYP